MAESKYLNSNTVKSDIVCSYSIKSKYPKERLGFKGGYWTTYGYYTQGLFFVYLGVDSEDELFTSADTFYAYINTDLASTGDSTWSKGW